MQRICITGGSGLLGAFVVEALATDFDVQVLDRRPPQTPVGYTECDVLDLTALERAVEGQDAIIHLAGIDAGNPFPDETYFRTNVVGTWNVLKAAEAAGARQVIVASSIAAYGIGTQRPPAYLPIDEEHPRQATGTYGLTKQLMETTCRSFAARGRLRVICLRPALIVRPQTEAPILAQLALESGTGEHPPRLRAPTEPYGELPEFRAYVCSGDAARCFRLALDYDDSAYAAFNVSAADSIGRQPTLGRVEELVGELPDVRDPGRYEVTRTAGILDTRAARDALGWEAKDTWASVERRHCR